MMGEVECSKGRIQWEKIVSGILLLVTLLGALYAWYIGSMLGFPDGHLTDFERAWESLLKLLCYGSLAFSVYFGIHLASSKVEKVKTSFWVGVGLYLVSMSAYFYKVHEYGLRLDNGQGG